MDIDSPLTVPQSFKFEKIAFVFNDQIGSDQSRTLDFYSKIEEENFLQGKKLLGEAWHYSKKPVSYSYNDLGYRTKNFSEIDKNNFFISYGCSFTEGVGLAEDEIWCSKLSEMIGVECLNLGLGGQGPEFVMINSLCFLKNSKFMPRFVVIQWPYFLRIVSRDMMNFHTLIPSLPDFHQSWKFYDDEIKNNRYRYSNYMALEQTKLLWKLAGVPVINWAIEQCYLNLDLYIGGNDEEALKHNLARDLGHFGPKFHLKAAKIINDFTIKEYKGKK